MNSDKNGGRGKYKQGNADCRCPPASFEQADPVERYLDGLRGRLLSIEQAAHPPKPPPPDPAQVDNENKRTSIKRALDYMGLTSGTKITDIPLDVVWIGSCTNGRIEDLRAVAKIVEGKKISDRLDYAMVVPGSGLVKEQAEAEGLDKIFLAAGFEWREPGCSMCLGMNPDQLKPGQRCASTSNRNFEGRQGYKGRTHLVSPIMAAAAALEGHFVDVRDYPGA